MNHPATESLGQFHGRIALVTGATSGIGLATARALTRQGMTVVLHCRDTVKAKQLDSCWLRTHERTLNCSWRICPRCRPS